MTQSDRREFFQAIAERADLVELETGQARFLVSTQDVDDEELYVTQTSEELELLTRATTVTTQAAIRSGGVVVLIADRGHAAVAAVASLGYERAIVCLPDLARCRLVRLNAALNGVADRVTALPVSVSTADDAQGSMVHAEARSVDQLCARGLIDPERLRLMVVAASGGVGALRNSAAVIDAGIPLALRPCAEASTTSLNRSLSKRYSRVFRLWERGKSPISESLDDAVVLEGVAGKAVLLTAES